MTGLYGSYAWGHRCATKAITEVCEPERAS